MEKDKKEMEMINSESFSQYSGDSKTKKEEGRFTQDNRISTKLDVPDYNSNSGFNGGKIFEIDDANQ